MARRKEHRAIPQAVAEEDIGPIVMTTLIMDLMNIGEMMIIIIIDGEGSK